MYRASAYDLNRTKVFWNMVKREVLHMNTNVVSQGSVVSALIMIRLSPGDLET